MTGIGPEPRHARLAAIQADRRAGDRIAVAMDELLIDARLMRRVGARLLTRGVSRSAGSTCVAIAHELGSGANALSTRIYRAGGASIRCFRREIILARLAAIVEQPRIPWPIAAEVLGAPRTQTLLGLVRQQTGMSPGLWRESASGAAQLTLFRSFLVMNAVAWSAVVPPGAFVRGGMRS
jgi:hypothetical protein